MQNNKQSGQFKKLKWMLRNRGPGYPSKRWGHTSVIYEKSLHIYGGNHSGNPREGIYKIDCQTLQASPILYEHMPPVRESHTCNLIKENLFVYGGCINQELTNDLLLFKVSENNNYWKKIEQKNPIPPRESHVSLTLTHKHILIYGGTTPTEQVLDDFWLIDLETGVWQQIVDIKGVLQPKIGCTIIMIQSNIYVFGGQFGEGEQSQYTNHIYTLQFENTNYSVYPPPSLTINKLEISGIRPSPRTGHCCIEYKSKFMIIIGGEGVSSKNAPILYNDIWMFDLKNYQWTELIVQNRSNFKPRSNFTANLYKNTIFIFGGFINLASFKSTDEFVTLTLFQNKTSTSNTLTSTIQYENKIQKSSQYCLTCKFQFINYIKPALQTKLDYKPINNALYCNYSNVQRTAMTISSSFQALALLLNTISNLPGSQKKQLTFDLQRTNLYNHKNGLQQASYIFSQEFLSIYANGIELTKKQLQLLIYLYNFDSYEVGFDFKTSILRLGRQFLLSYVFNDDMIHLYYFLNHNMYHFIFHKNALAYQIKQKVQYSLLLEFINHYNIDISALYKQCFNLFIGSLHKNNGNLEIHQQQMKYDIKCQLKNVRMLFSDYIKQYFFAKIPLILYFRGVKLQTIAYSKSLHNPKDIQPITSSFSKVSLELDQEPLVQYNSPFIKVYYENRRVGTFNKYPFISGYLLLKDGSSLNFARTRCESWQVRDNLQKQVENAIQTCKKREAGFISLKDEKFYPQQIQ